MTNTSHAHAHKSEQSIIYKINLELTEKPHVAVVPSSSRFISLGWDTRKPDVIAIWFRVRDTDGELVDDPWRLSVVGTGHRFPRTAHVLGTVTDSGFEWHVLDLDGTVRQ